MLIYTVLPNAVKFFFAWRLPFAAYNAKLKLSIVMLFQALMKFLSRLV
jgi:hypothetical protein